MGDCGISADIRFRNHPPVAINSPPANLVAPSFKRGQGVEFSDKANICFGADIESAPTIFMWFYYCINFILYHTFFINSTKIFLTILDKNKLLWYSYT